MAYWQVRVEIRPGTAFLFGVAAGEAEAARDKAEELIAGISSREGIAVLELREIAPTGERERP